MMYLTTQEKDNFETIKARPDTMAQICAHIAQGGAIDDLCKVWGVPFHAVQYWINSDDSRYSAYQRALRDQLHWAIDRVIKELKRLGTVDIAGAYDDKGNLKPIQDIPPDVRACISSIDVFEEYEGTGNERELIGYTKRIKVFDKIKALELMGKKFAMWIDRTSLDVGTKSLEELIAESNAIDSDTNAGKIETGESKVIDAQVVDDDKPVTSDGKNVALNNIEGDPPPGDL